jgi:hypothetical protein
MTSLRCRRQDFGLNSCHVHRRARPSWAALLDVRPFRSVPHLDWNRIQASFVELTHLEEVSPLINGPARFCLVRVRGVLPTPPRTAQASGQPSPGHSRQGADTRPPAHWAPLCDPPSGGGRFRKGSTMIWSSSHSDLRSATTAQGHSSGEITGMRLRRGRRTDGRHRGMLANCSGS